MGKPTIKVNFSDFGQGFNCNYNYFTIALSERFNVEISKKPDFLFHSVYGNSFLKYNCFRICHTGENTRPDFSKDDFSLGFDYIDDERYFRWPLFLLTPPHYYKKHDDIDGIFEQKTKFCSFVASNGFAKERVNFFNLLSKYRKVDSGGNTLNNIGYRVQDKREFLKPYKFNIAFENSSYPGYTTEKIIDSVLAGSIPIYWGNPIIDRDFNPKSFINVHDYSSFEEAVEYIMEVDRDDKLYKEILSEPFLYNNEVPKKFEISSLVDYLEYIYSHKDIKKPIAKKSDKYYYFFSRFKRKIKEKLCCVFKNK